MHTKLKEKNYINISIYAEKACDKVQHVLIIKVLETLGIYVIYFKLIKPAYNNPIANIMEKK